MFPLFQCLSSQGRIQLGSLVLDFTTGTISMQIVIKRRKINILTLREVLDERWTETNVHPKRNDIYRLQPINPARLSSHHYPDTQTTYSRL